MKHKKFWDVGQATNYLSSSIVRVGDLPVYVTECNNGPPERSGVTPIVMYYVECANSSGKTRTINIMDPAVDLNPVPLGMTSYFNGVEWETYYLSRKPARMWKVGLTRSNLHISFPDPNMRITLGDMSRSVLPSRMLSETIMARYNSFEDAKTVLRKHKGIIALSRFFCLNSKGELFFTTIGEPVGDVDKGGIKLRPAYKFLAEKLQEDIK